MIPSSRALLSRDKRLPLDTMESVRSSGKNFWNQFSTFDSPRGYPQKIQSDDVQRNREAVPEAGRTKTSLTSEDGQNYGAIPMSMFASRPLRVLNIRLIFPRITWSDSKYWKLQFDAFPNPSSFLVWGARFKKQVSSGSDFSSEAMLWIKEVEMVDSVDELKSSRSVHGKDFLDFEMLDVKIASALNKIIQKSQFKKKVSLEEQKAQSRGPVSARETNRLHDLRLHSSDWRSWHSIGLCWFILCYSSWWQHSGIRCELGRSSIIDDKNSIRWNLGKSVQIEDSLFNSKTYWSCTTWRLIRRHRFPTIKSWKPWWKDV